MTCTIFNIASSGIVAAYVASKTSAKGLATDIILVSLNILVVFLAEVVSHLGYLEF